MKISYKIALIVSVAVCALALVMFMGKNQPDPTQATNAQDSEATTPETRKTLRAGAPGDGSLKSMVKAQTASTSNEPHGTIAEDARSRVLASRTSDATRSGASNSGSSASDTDGPQASTAVSPLGSGSSGAIALARTGPGTTKQTTKTTPAKNINQQDLDAALGSSDRPAVPWPDKTSSSNAPKDSATNTPTASDSTDASGTYLVQPGDTVSSIANKLYNDERRWVDISQANFVDPTKLKVGQVLKLPGDRAQLSSEEPAPPGPGGIQTYTIRPGDSLSTVAQEYYGDPTLWRTIYNFNSDKIGKNPNAIQADMVLKIPPAIKSTP